VAVEREDGFGGSSAHASVEGKGKRGGETHIGSEHECTDLTLRLCQFAITVGSVGAAGPEDDERAFAGPTPNVNQITKQTRNLET
jgi:hypothetical protein